MIWSDCAIEVSGDPDEVAPGAVQHAVEALPDEVLQFLLPSRYCDSDKLSSFAWARFGQIEAGWPRVQAICDFVHSQTTFNYSSGRPDKTAADVQMEQTAYAATSPIWRCRSAGR